MIVYVLIRQDQLEEIFNEKDFQIIKLKVSTYSEESQFVLMNLIVG
jgi:hypothetical protein